MRAGARAEWWHALLGLLVHVDALPHLRNSPPHITLAFSRTFRPWSLPVSGSTYLPRPRSEVLDTRAGKVPREAGVMGKVRGARDEQTRCAGPTGDKESERE